MDPYSSPYIIPNNSHYNPFPHSLLSTRESSSGCDQLMERFPGNLQTPGLAHENPTLGLLWEFG